MSSGIYIATAGAVAQSNAMDITANNIANATTTGFHGDHITFKEALGKARSVDTSAVGAGNARIDSLAGAMQQTDNPLDLAIEGDGMFAVKTAQGTRYTRAGNFKLDEARDLVTADGNKVLGEGGQPIALPANATQIAVGSDGTVSADGVTVGKLQVTSWKPSQLKREGSTLFAASGKPEVPKAGEAPKVHSGVLEGSNVNVVRGIVDLVKVSRQYESLMRVIQNYHDTESRAARDLGGPK